MEVERTPFVYTNQPELPFQVWAGFEDTRSIDIKVNYLMNAGLGGAMLFSIDSDDYSGVCAEEEYPLLRVISYHLNKNKTNIAYPDLRLIFQETEAELVTVDGKISMEALFEKFESSEDKSTLELIAFFFLTFL